MTAPPEASTKRNGYRPWAPEEELHLERLVASGMSYADIATTLDRPIHGVYSRVSDSGINKRWPRTSRGALQYEPYPLDAPWPPSAEQMVPVTPSTRKAELLALMDEGLSAREIADKLDIAPSGVSARATQWGYSAQWRAARDRRQAQQAAAVEPVVLDKPVAARDVAPGESWAFEHRTQAEVAAAEPPPEVPQATAHQPDIALKPQHTTVLQAIRQLAAEGVIVTGSLLASHLGWSQVTASRYIKDLVNVGKVVNKGASTAPRYVLADVSAPVAAPASQPEPKVTLKPQRDYTVVVWTEERKNTLDRMARQGCEAEEIAQAVGLDAAQVKAQVMRQCLSTAWAEAKEAKAGAARFAGKPAPKREVLPEDRLRAGPTEPAGVPADLETVENWLVGNGCKLVVEAPGLYFGDGAMLTATELVKRANKARKLLQLPPFAVRRL